MSNSIIVRALSCVVLLSSLTAVAAGCGDIPGGRPSRTANDDTRRDRPAHASLHAVDPSWLHRDDVRTVAAAQVAIVSKPGR